MQGWRVVDLSQPLGPGTPRWPGAIDVTSRARGSIELDGMYERDLSLPEHVGTHLDAPAHFAPNAAQVHQIPVEQLLVAARVLDGREAVDGDPDGEIEPAVVRRHEADHGPIHRGEAVLVRTGWDAHLHDHARYVGPPGGPPRFPGLTPAAAALLVQRGVVGLGIDTLGVDPGRATHFPVHRLTMEAGLWHLEGLVELGELPALGAWLSVGVLPLVEGSGAPARVFGLVPRC